MKELAATRRSKTPQPQPREEATAGSAGFQQPLTPVVRSTFSPEIFLYTLLVQQAASLLALSQSQSLIIETNFNRPSACCTFIPLPAPTPFAPIFDQSRFYGIVENISDDAFVFHFIFHFMVIAFSCPECAISLKQFVCLLRGVAFERVHNHIQGRLVAFVEQGHSSSLFMQAPFI